MARNLRGKSDSQLQQDALKYQGSAKRELESQLGSHEPFSSANPGLTGTSKGRMLNASGAPSAGYQNYMDRMGIVDLGPRGYAPDDRTVRKYIDNTGGNPYLQELDRRKNFKKSPEAQREKAQKRQLRKQQAAASAQASTNRSLQERFYADVRGKTDEANRVNEERYQDILGDLEARYDRGMGRAENWGESARADLDERFAESLGDVQAGISARGFGMSTKPGAFAARSDRELAREHQRVSEMGDIRAGEIDARLSGDVARFKEARTDEAPDFNAQLALSRALGAGNDGQGFDNLNNVGGYGGGGYGRGGGGYGGGGYGKAPMIYGMNFPYANMNYGGAPVSRRRDNLPTDEALLEEMDTSYDDALPEEMDISYFNDVQASEWDFPYPGPSTPKHDWEVFDTYMDDPTGRADQFAPSTSWNPAANNTGDGRITNYNYSELPDDFMSYIPEHDWEVFDTKMDPLNRRVRPPARRQPKPVRPQPKQDWEVFDTYMDRPPARRQPKPVRPQPKQDWEVFDAYMDRPPARRQPKPARPQPKQDWEVFDTYMN